MNRGLLSEAFYETSIKPWLKDNMDQFDHDILANVAFCLVAEKQANEDLWRSLIQRVISHPLRVPLHYLQNIKYA